MKRLDSLDGVRGMLAVYVMLGHMAPFAALPNWLQDAVSHGGAAVDIFFVLSGLVITQSLVRADGRAGPFLVARVARIFPVFLAVFALAVAVAPMSCGFERMPWIQTGDLARAICAESSLQGSLPEIIAHLTMTHGLFPYTIWPHVWVSFLGSAWSLSTEWQFYVLALLTFRHNRHLCWVLVAMAVAGMAWRLTVPEPLLFSRAFLPNKAHFFALGVASVNMVREDRGALRRYGVVLAATIAICSTEGSLGKLLPPLAWTFFLTVQMRPDLLGLRQVSLLLRSRIARYLGAIWYCVYLANEPIQKLVGYVLSMLAGGDGRLFTAFWIPLSIGLPLLAAIWLHAYLEVPALRWGRDFARRLSADHGAVTVQASG
jgi:peptidoglycan/LPS O-acetylase OafA/YrhL